MLPFLRRFRTPAVRSMRTLQHSPCTPLPDDSTEIFVTAPDDNTACASLATGRVMGRIAVVPAYNEEETVVATLETLTDFVDALIVVNDGSADATRTRLLDWAATAPRPLYLLDLPENTGMAGALGAGLAQALVLQEAGLIGPDDLLINVDADGQHQLASITAMCRLLDAGDYDMVLARRDLRSYPWSKRLGNWGMSALGSLLAGQRYHDIESGLRVLRARVLPELLAFYAGSHYSCAQEIAIILARRGFRVTDAVVTPILYYRSRTRLRDVFNNLRCGLRACLACTLDWRHTPQRFTRVAAACLLQSPSLRPSLPPDHSPR